MSKVLGAVVPPTRAVVAPAAPSDWVDASFAVVEADWRACLQVAWAVSTSLRMLVMPLLAASSVLTERPMLSSSRERSFARAEKPAATKKLSGLSSAVVHLLARRETVLGRAHQVGRVLQCEKVIANA